MALKQKIKELQRADDGTKKKWLIVISGISMVAIIFLWVIYLNATVPTISKQTAREVETSSSEKSAYETFKSGLQTIKNDFDKRFSATKEVLEKNLEMIKNQAGQQKEYSINPPTFTNTIGAGTNSGDSWESGGINLSSTTDTKTDNINDSSKQENFDEQIYKPLKIEPMPATTLP